MNPEAEEHFQKAAELDPEDRDAFFNLGIVLIRAEKFQDALVPLQKVTQMDEKDKEALYWIGAALVRLKEYDKAIASLTHAIEIDPTYVDAYVQRGIAKREKGLKKQAAEDFKTAEELKKGRP